MAEQKVKEIKTIPEGRHEGTIVSVIRRDPTVDKSVKFDYTDYNIQLDNVEGKPIIKYGVPSEISVDGTTGEARTNHAKILKQLGFTLKGTIDTDKSIGLKVSVLIQNEDSGRGTFATVVDGSIKRI
jgi:hypothetical protein